MKKSLIIGASLLAPVAAFAQLSNIQNQIVTPLGNIINMLIPIVFALAMLFFFWGMALYIFASGDEGKKEEGKNKMIWGIVALFVMSAIWGIIRFLAGTLDLQPGEGANFDPTDLVPGQ